MSRLKIFKHSRGGVFPKAMVALAFIVALCLGPPYAAAKGGADGLVIKVRFKKVTLPPQARVSIHSPLYGQRLSGSAVALEAKVEAGEPEQIGHVTFQYRPAAGGVWTPIASVDKPDDSQPYVAFWSITGLQETTYELRAIATSITGVSDPDPPSITVSIDHTQFDVKEILSESGEHQRWERIFISSDNKVRMWGEDGKILLQVEIPQGVLQSEAPRLKMVSQPAVVPELPGELISSGEFRILELEDGQTQFSRPITVLIPYRDQDQDGVVDGTGISERHLRAFAYRALEHRWEALPSQVDQQANQVIFKTSHFSYFAVLGMLPLNFSQVRVYPNPFKPGQGDDEITFDNLPVDSRIRVYTISGELVWERDDIQGGNVKWLGARNVSGRKVASGLYLYLITSPDRGKATGKIGVLR